MKTLSVTVSALLLLNVLLEVSSSNPDSELFQDPSNENEKNNPKRSVPTVLDSRSEITSQESQRYRVRSTTTSIVHKLLPGRYSVLYCPVAYLVQERGGYVYRRFRHDSIPWTGDIAAANSDCKRFDQVGRYGPEIPDNLSSGSPSSSSASRRENGNVKTGSSGDGAPGERSPNQADNTTDLAFPDNLSNMNAKDNRRDENVPIRATRSPFQNAFGFRDRYLPNRRTTSYNREPHLERRPSFSTTSYSRGPYSERGTSFTPQADLDINGNPEYDRKTWNDDYDINPMLPQRPVRPVDVTGSSSPNPIRESANRAPDHVAGAFPSINPIRESGNRMPGRESKPSPATVGDQNKRVPPDSNLLSGIINDFSFNLVKTLNLDANFVLSPMSIFIGLAMCYLGSEGSTKQQLEDVLGLGDRGIRDTKLHQGVKDLESLITSGSSDYQLLLANAMFLGKRFSVNPPFEELVRKYYTAELRNVDFANPQESVPVINDWVSRSTGNMIRNFFSNSPGRDVQALVLNAIYFKGIWKTQFPLQWTYEGNFFPATGDSRDVPTMVLYNETFPYFRSKDHQHTFLKLPYQGDQISMIIALPFHFGQQPMPTMTDQILCSIRDAMTDTRLDSVSIPRFKFEHAVLLKSAFQRLGITHLFDPGTVDLSFMRQQNDVVVSKITHKAVIEVNEQGTTAAAVTSLNIVPLSYKNTTDFNVNHPFAFYVLHESSGQVLFYGKVHDIDGKMVNDTPDSPTRGEEPRGERPVAE